MKLIKKLIFCVAFISCSVYAQFFPYTDITIDIQDENRQFSVDREYYGTTPFYEFTITDNGSAVDLSGWDFALKYGYDKNANVLYTFTGSDYISVTNNKVLVNGTTNYWFEPHNDYYIALEGTYSSGNYKYIFAEGSMNVTYSPASDEAVNNILNGLTFTLFNGSDFVAYTNYINSTVRPEDLGTMAYVSTNDYATISITNNIVALEAGTNTWNSAIQPDDLGSAAYSNATDFATAAEGDLAVTALQTNDVGSAAFSNATDFATAAQGILANTALQTNDVGSAAFASTNDFATAAQGTLSDTALQTNDVGSAAFAETSDFATAAEGDLAITALQPNDVGSAAYASVESFATDAELSATSNTLATATSAVAESVVNLSYVVNPSLWGLSINGDLEPAGVSFGLLDDGLFEIDLTTGDIVLTGTQSTRFWQVSGSDIYPEVN